MYVLGYFWGEFAASDQDENWKLLHESLLPHEASSQFSECHNPENLLQHLSDKLGLGACCLEVGPAEAGRGE